jgi:F-type H+-transporting ATPase subunit delta
MASTRIARRYAAALMEVAEEARAVDRVAADLELIGATVRGARDLRLLLGSPVVSGARKKGVLDALFAARIARPTSLFLALLVQKQRERYLPDIVEQFAALRDERQGVVTAEVAAAVELSAAQQQELGRRLEQATKKRVRLRLRRDADIGGGVVVRIGDTVFDASVRHQLKVLRERLLTGGSPTNTKA